MDPGGTRCPVRRDKPDIWAMMKDQYEDRAATLQAKEDELKLRIAQMESLLSSRLSESCCCTSSSNTVPKVFPRKMDSPVRDTPKFSDSPPSCVTVCLSSEHVSPGRQRTTSRKTTPVRAQSGSPARSQSPKKQPNAPTFFQKVMENAKSILTLKCNPVHPTLDEHPTRENDVVAYSSNLNRKKSNCSCDFDEETTRIDFTESTYSQDVSNSFCCKTCNLDSISTVKSRKTTSAMVNTYSFCNTSTSTDNRAMAEDGSQYIPSDFSVDQTQYINMDHCWVCPSSKSSRKSQSCGGDSSKKQSCNNKTCASYLSVRRRLSQPNVNFKECDPEKKQRSKSQIKEVDIQCAFIGSPMLNAADYATPNKVLAPQVNQDGDKSECTPRGPRPTTPQEKNITTVTDMASKERQIRSQIESLQGREKNYNDLFNNYQNMANDQPCCCCQPRGQADRIDKISQELRLENKVLKDELMQMKLELKHCLEKVEGPMKSQLETEKMRCVQLEQDLNFASKNMVVNQDTHMREMNAMKLQLCMACSNINELNSMNRRLKEEMTSLDCMCTKLEDDLMKQKISEAETIKLLRKRRGDTSEGVCTCSKTAVQEKFSCDSNLHVIARKLSKTLKESEPCEECAKLPAELTGAAKCIKDLSDLVESRKVKRTELEEPTKKPPSEEEKKVASSQAPPETMDEASQCMEGQRGDEAKTTTILAPVQLQEQLSSEIEVKISSMEPVPSEITDKPPTESLFFSAAGEPMAICPDICDKPCPPTCDTNKTCIEQGKPCLVKEPKTKEIPSSVSKVIDELKKITIDSIEESGEDRQVPTEEAQKVLVGEGEGEQIQETPIEGAVVTDEGVVAKSIEKPIEKEMAYTVQREPVSEEPEEFRKAWQPLKCTESCGSDQPCAKGQPCFVIKGRGDQPQETNYYPTETPIVPESVIEVKISDTVDTTAKLTMPSDAVIEPSEPVVERPEEKDIVETPVLVQEAGIATFAAPATTESEQVESYEITDFTTGPTISELPTDKTTERTIETSEAAPGEKEPEPTPVLIIEEQEVTSTPYQVEEGVAFETFHAPVSTELRVTEEQVVEEKLGVIITAMDQPSVTRTLPEGITEKRSELPPSEGFVADSSVAVPPVEARLAATVKPSSIAKPSVTITEPISEDEHVFEVVEESLSTAQQSSEAKVPPASTEEQRFDLISPRQAFPPSLQAPSFPTGQTFVEETTGNFPFEVDTKVEILDVPPSDIHVTTTITASGTLEVITEGPEALIETTLVYEPDGTIKVVTHVTEEETKMKEFKSSSVRISPDPASVYEPTTRTGLDRTLPRVEQESFLSGMTDYDGMETVTESTKETTLISSYPSVFDKAMAAKDSKPGSSMATMGPTMEYKSSEVRDASGMGEASSKAPSTGVELGYSKLECCEEDAASRAGVEGKSTMECCQITVSGTGMDTTSAIEGTTSFATEPVASMKECCEQVIALDGTATPYVEDYKKGIEAEPSGTREEISSKFRKIVEEEVMNAIPGEVEEKGTTFSDGKDVKLSQIISERVSEVAGGPAETSFVEGKSSHPLVGAEAAGRKEEITAKFREVVEEEIMHVLPEEIGTKESALQRQTTVKASGTITEQPGKETTETVAGITEEKTEKLEAKSGTDRVADKSAQQALTGQKRDCGCQATPQAEQSCQCCECKDVGVSTSRDSETLTDDNMVQADVLHHLEEAHEVTELGPESRLSAAPDVSGTSRDAAEAITVDSGQIQGTTDEVSTIHEAISSFQDPQSLKEQPKRIPKDSKTPKDGEYKNKRGKTVKDTECACSDLSEDEEVSTADRAAQCECNGPIERDDHSEGRPSSRSDTDRDRHKKKPFEDSDNKKGKPVKTIHPITSKAEDFDEIIAHLDPHTIKDKRKKEIEPEEYDVGQKKQFSDSSIAKDQPKKVKPTRSKDSDHLKDKPRKVKPVKSDDDMGQKKPSHHEREPCSEPDTRKEKSRKTKPVKSEDDIDTPKPSSHKKEEQPSAEPDITRRIKPTKSEDLSGEEELSQIKKKKEPASDPGVAKDKTKKKVAQKDDSDVEQEQLRSKENDDEEKSSSESMEIPDDGKKKKAVKDDTDKDQPHKLPAKKEKKVPSKPKSDEDRKRKIKRKDTMEYLSDVSSVTASEVSIPHRTESLEVPGSTIAPPSDITDPKKPRKKRTSSQRLQNIECDCPGVCQCVICSPKIIAERKARTGSPSPPTGEKGRPCWCSAPPQSPSSPPSQTPKSVVQPPSQTPKSFAEDLPVEEKEHPTGCQCVNCLCRPCTPCPPQYRQEAFLRSTNLTSTQTVTPKNKKRISVDDVFGPSEDVLTECRVRIECQKAERAPHPPNCECVDCLCLPKIKRIAETREHPIIRDEKQVYQVKCYCENTRKPLSTSKIPIPTNSTTGPPKAKSSISCTCGDCKCTPCSDVNQVAKKSSSGQKQTRSEASPTTDTSKQPDGTLEMTLSELAKLCDCQSCKCTVCFDKPPKKTDESVATADQPEDKTKKSGKNCCCTGDCTCAVCPVDQMSKRALDTGKTDDSSPTSAPLRSKRLDLHKNPDDCDCEECICPHSKAIRSESSLSLGPPEDCDCEDCFCPNSMARLGKTDSKTKNKMSARTDTIKAEPGVTPKPSTMKPQGCTCGECICPGKEAALKATGDSSQCICSTCPCPSKDLMTSTTPGSVRPPSSTPQDQAAKSMPSIPEGSSIADCDCIDCQCNPCADPKRQKVGPVIAPCDCPDCNCEPCADPSKRKDKGDASERLLKGEVGVMASSLGTSVRATTSAGVGSTENKATHPPDCICDECLCHPEEHGKGCTCPECKCVDCYAKKMDTAVHAEGCQCKECTCAPCMKESRVEAPSQRSGVVGSGESKSAEEPGDCTCDICKCVDCFNKPKHGSGCTCSDCICIDCPKLGKAGAASKGPIPEKKNVPLATGQPVANTRSCHCIKCECDICTSKEAGSPGRAPNCTCEVCQCSDCGNTEYRAELTNKECTCVVCQCDECVIKKTEAPSEPVAAVRSGPPQTEDVKPAGSKKAVTISSPFTDPPPFEVPIRKHCANRKCICPECDKAGIPSSDKKSPKGVIPPATAEAPPFEVPVRAPCKCGKCGCPDCNKQAATTRSTTTGDMQSTTQQATSTSFAFSKVCKCERCDCDVCNPQGAALRTAVSFGASPTSPSPSPPPQSSRAAAPTPAAVSTMTKCDCPTCTCPEDAHKAQTAPASGFQTVASKSTGLLAQEDHPVGCSCPKCCICPVKMASSQVRKDQQIEEEIIKISQMDNETLMKRIQTDKKENCKCKEQIKEIRQALDKIKCSCSEAEMKAIRTTSAKPFVKQASTFGQTMSGLKFALHNLQEKCKAKDKLIDAMTGELKTRTSSNTFERVLNSNANVEAPDYDKTDDIKSFERGPENTTNILFAVNEEKEIGHTNVQPKTSGHRHKRKSKVCKCGKQHKERANSKVDLAGFEVVDIRRITQDSIIIKWKPPQSNLITGYDIFVNGVNKSKVMSGGRTSAMVHSLDLSSTIQITIYAVTKCGRCEPPAIAIYEINS